MTGASEVDAFMATLDHPLKAEIGAARGWILGVDPGIEELIKWKAPTFRFKDDFATVNLRSTDGLQLIFHTGAKVKASATTGVTIVDPAGLLRWLAKDRALVTVPATDEGHAAFIDIVRQWIALM